MEHDDLMGCYGMLWDVMGIYGILWDIHSGNDSYTAKNAIEMT